MATILVLGVKVPFTRGGQETLMRSLVSELERRGHEVDVIELPFRCPPKEGLLNQVAWWRSLDLQSFIGKQVDLVIATKFPSYFARHPRKSLWLVHQHRPLYDLYGGPYSDFSDDPRDEALRRMLHVADDAALRECAFVSGISRNVVQRLERYNGVQGEVLYPPLPLGSRYRNEESKDYLLYVGRICGIKRVDLMLKAMPIVHHFMKFKIVGSPDEPGIMEYLKNEVDKHHLWDRVEFVGRVDDERLIELYAQASAVYYAPHNEDYGYVTLEAMASGKPVITAHDSGGVLEFVRHGENGVVLEPSIHALGHGVNELLADRERMQRMGAQGRADLEELGVFDAGWEKVVDGLLSPLNHSSKAAHG